MDAAVIILAITLALAATVKILQRKLVDREKVKLLQKQIKEDNKRYFALIKEGEKNKKEIDELHSRIMKNQMETMNSSMKLNFIILPVFLAALWGLGYLFANQFLVSLIPLPTFHAFSLWNPTSWVPQGLSMESGYYKIYFFYYIISTISIAIVERIYDAIRHPKEKTEKNKTTEKKKKEELIEKKENAENEKVNTENASENEKQN